MKAPTPLEEKCEMCGAEPGTPCCTPSENAVPGGVHAVRWKALTARLWRDVVRLKHDVREMRERRATQ